MTQIVLRNSIDTTQMNVLRGLFNSWNVAVEIKEEKESESKLSEEFTDYLLNAEKDIQNDENILRFKDNAAGFEYLEKLMQ